MDIETKENTQIIPNTNTSKPLLPVKSDFVFKHIFGDRRNADILASFLRAVLDLPEDEYEKLTIADPHVKKESENDKYGILDVKVHTKSGNVIHVEVQLWVIPELKERSIYYQSKMITEQFSSGADYISIKRVVSIIITDYILVKESDHYHNMFRYRTKDGIEFTNATEINTLELKKLPATADSSELWDWMKFIKSDDKEAMGMLEQRSPALKRAVGVLKELSADEQMRMLYEDQEKARRDIASMVGGALREGEARGIAIGEAKGIAQERTAFVRRLLRRSRPMDEIIEYSGLTQREIEEIIQNDNEDQMLH